MRSGERSGPSGQDERDLGTAAGLAPRGRHDSGDEAVETWHVEHSYPKSAGLQRRDRICATLSDDVRDLDQLRAERDDELDVLESVQIRRRAEFQDLAGRH